MKEPIAGLVAGAIAITAGGGASIVAEGWPGAVLAAMERVTASVGRCGVCGLEKAAWKGQGIRLCETCYQREARRAVEAGELAVG